MKTENMNIEEFKPVKILLTFETQAELDAMASLFNTTFITEAIRVVGGGNVPDTNVFEDAGGNMHKVDEIVKAIENSSYFRYIRKK